MRSPIDKIARKLLYTALTSCVLLPLSTVASAQSPVPSRSRPAPGGMTVEDVIKLVKAGIGEDIIVQQIKKSSHGPSDLSTDQLIQLKTSSVSDRIIQVLLDPSRPEGGPPPTASNPSSMNVHPPKEPPPPKIENTTPTETGMYVRKAEQWVDVAPEIVYWKTGGVLKSVATAGIVHGNLNGHVAGPRSPNKFATPIDFLIVAPDGAAITEYQLVRLHLNKDNREFRTVTGGVFHSQSGAVRDLIPFEGTKVAAHVFRVTFQSSLGAGEYGFLPPGSTGSSGRIYSFHVIE